MIKFSLIIMAFILCFTTVFADTNGIWVEAKDIRGGTFGSDESGPEYVFPSGVNFSTGISVGGNVQIDGNVFANEVCIDGHCKTNWSTIWTPSGNNILYTKGNVGIGRTPQYPLDISSNSYYSIRTDSTGYGIRATGDFGGGYFRDNDQGTYAYVANGDNAFRGYGDIQTNGDISASGAVYGDTVFVPSVVIQPPGSYYDCWPSDYSWKGITKYESGNYVCTNQDEQTMTGWTESGTRWRDASTTRDSYAYCTHWDEQGEDAIHINGRGQDSSGTIVASNREDDNGGYLNPGVHSYWGMDPSWSCSVTSTDTSQYNYAKGDSNWNHHSSTVYCYRRYWSCTKTFNENQITSNFIWRK